jgi:tRNA pseudouridine55 synthase
VAGFVGRIEQVPPAYSAAKLSGRRAYDIARGGEEVTLGPRRVQIHRIDVVAYSWPELELEIECGRGTYIRSLARDLGERLGTGGHVRTLRRTRVGPFTVEMGTAPDVDAETARTHVLPAKMAVVELPGVRVPEEVLRRLCQGQRVAQPDGVAEGEVALLTETGELAAVAAVGEGVLRPVKVLMG